VSVQNPYSMHFQSVWGERAADPALPLWIRLASIAFATHRANGHANFDMRELSLILGKPGVGGAWEYVDKASISRAIAAAKKAGWIAEESNAKCLVVPYHAITGGLGHENERCPVHGKCSANTGRARSKAKSAGRPSEV
jgi:hypothetical protein